METVPGYLELNTRSVLPRSHRIDCANRPEVIYVKDKKGVFWVKKKDLPFERIKVGEEHYRLEAHTPHLARFNEKILHYKPALPHRTTLLHLLAQQQDNLRQLDSYRTKGEPLTSGIMRAFTMTIDGLEDAGIKLIDSISGGIVKVSKGLGNTTEGLIDSTSVGVSRVIKSVGGLPTVVVFGIELLILGYLAFDRWQRPRGVAPPPVPIRRV